MLSGDVPSARCRLTVRAQPGTALLVQLRAARGFDPAEVAEAKLGRLARFFVSQQLDSAVVGVSGGVDSALVLGLLRALERRGTLRRVVPVLLPIESPGATRQREALANGQLVTRALDSEGWEAVLTGAHEAMRGALEGAAQLPFTPWSEGQLVSVMRTPALYGAAALLQGHGYRSLVVGTTNRDEGALLGFFGKASDGMVDLQPISDLHKSEVRALARYVGVPEQVVDATPSGDVHDGRSDEEMIGASYDEVELYLRLRELGMHTLLDASPALDAIERQLLANQHKYRVGNSAVHLDVMPRGVPGGWSSEVLAPRSERRPPAEALPGSWDPPAVALDPVSALATCTRLPVPGYATRGEGVLTTADCACLRAAMDASGCAEPVGMTGVRGSYGVGSTRATGWSPALAASLWHRLAPIVPSVRFCDDFTASDWFATSTRTGHRSWRAVGLSPLLRFMRYEVDGRHLCHYDAGFDYGDGRRTLMSVIFYLSDAEQTGATRFVRDGQERTPVAQRSFADWSEETAGGLVLAEVQPRAGSALVFDHRLCHDVERWSGPGPRIIIRADVVYEVIPDGRS